MAARARGRGSRYGIDGAILETRLGSIGKVLETATPEPGGSVSVMASLWSVREKQAGELMEAFFRHLHQGVCKADTLRMAQSETHAKHPNPYFWASFVLTGDPGDCSQSLLQ
jgi:CHAT domain